MKRCLLCLCVVFAVIGGVLAQTQPEKLKLPGPDVQNLMLGTWKTVAQYERTADMPNGGTASGIETWRLGPGGLSVIEESSEKNAQGDMAGLGKRRVYSEVFRDITPTSFTQVLQEGEPGGALETTVTIRATKAPETRMKMAAATLDQAHALIGTWRVVEFADLDKGGKWVHLFGEHPRGYFVYDATGHVHIQIMKVPPLKPFPEANPDDGKPPTAGHALAAFNAYVWYFGTYTVDVEKHVVTHHVEGSLSPDYTDTDVLSSWTATVWRLAMARLGDVCWSGCADQGCQLRIHVLYVHWLGDWSSAGDYQTAS
jgi:hypothetical protein